jgi:hypothetical protein
MKGLRIFLMTLPLCLSAGVFQTSGIINLTGGGGLQNPNYDGFGLGLTLFASGSNRVDTVTVSAGLGGGIAVLPPELPPTDLQDYYLTNLIFDLDVGRCVGGISTLFPICTATIDGISGYGAFSNLGGGIGLVQVYEYPAYSPTSFQLPGPLLAEAQVFSQSQVTGVTYGIGPFNCPTCPPQCPLCPAGQGRFDATFSLEGDPPADPQSTSSVPEPTTGILALAGYGLMMNRKVRAWLRAGLLVRKWKFAGMVGGFGAVPRGA